MSVDKDMARRIVERREALGLSQEKLARFADVSAQTVGRIERCETEPKAGTVKKIADALQSTVAYLYGESPFPDAPRDLPATGTEGN